MGEFACFSRRSRGYWPREVETEIHSRRKVPAWQRWLAAIFFIFFAAGNASGEESAYEDALEKLHRTEMPVIRAVQAEGKLAPLMRWVSEAGLGKLNGAVIAVIFFAVSPGLALRLTFFYACGMAMREILALALHSPRPWWVEPEMMRLGDTSLRRPTFGLPSGHAMMSSAFWLFIATEARRRWALLAAILFILLVCYSRVYLGAHFVSDVTLGFALGAGYVALYRHFGDRVVESWSGATRTRKALFFAALSGTLLAAGWAARGIAAGPFPAEWAGLARRARSLVAIAGYAGMICGAGCALAAARPARFPGRWELQLGGLGAVAALVLGFYFLAPPIRTLPWPEWQKVSAEFALRSAEGFAAFCFVPWLAAAAVWFRGRIR